MDRILEVLAFEVSRSSALCECLAQLSDERPGRVRVVVRDAAATEPNDDGPGNADRVCVVVANGGHSTELIRRIRQEWPLLPLLAATESGEPVDILEWLDAGAADYVMPPFTRAALLPRLMRLARDLSAREALDCEIDGLVGRSSAFRALLDRVRAVARCDGTVLIEGESGTGKELCARAIHRLSAREKHPFCAVNCGSIPRDLVENELFGHRKAAFTGASGTHAGLVGEAEGGTLFFDEVDCFGPGEQATLLRFLENGEYRPLGATRVKKANVRILAATNAQLGERARQGAFREDLFFRLDMLRVHLPPLRDRKEDIPLLARHALLIMAARFHASARSISPDAMRALIAHDWPGNVRELEHTIGRAVAFAYRDEVIGPEHLEIRDRTASAPPARTLLRDEKRRVVTEFERSQICGYLAASDGNITSAARAAGKNRRAFFELMRKHAIRAEEFQKARAP